MKECERICQAIKEGVRCVLLRGAAGTGKTTLVRDLLPHIRLKISACPDRGFA